MNLKSFPRRGAGVRRAGILHGNAGLSVAGYGGNCSQGIVFRETRWDGDVSSSIAPLGLLFT